MKKMRRWWKHRRAEGQLAGRREEITARLQSELGLPARPGLKLCGSLGHDSNYHVYVGAERLGVLRLVNPHKKRPPPAPGMPYIVAEPATRLAREMEICRKGFAHGLTPEPLWLAQDALLCRYLPYRPLLERARRDPKNIWDVLCDASHALHRLHSEVGVAHMDASLANVLSDETGQRVALVDYEYMPIEGLSFAQQKIYDHLRLLHSSWKYIHIVQRYGYRRWFDQFAFYVDDAMRAAKLRLIAPGISNVLNEAPFRAELAQLLDDVP